MIDRLFMIRPRSGSTIIEFAVVSMVIGVLLCFVIFLIDEFIDRQHLNLVVFRALREVALQANSNNAARISLKDLEMKILSELKIRNIDVKFNILENEAWRVKIRFSFTKHGILDTFFTEEIEICR